MGGMWLLNSPPMRGEIYGLHRSLDLERGIGEITQELECQMNAVCCSLFPSWPCQEALLVRVESHCSAVDRRSQTQQKKSPNQGGRAPFSLIGAFLLPVFLVSARE